MTRRAALLATFALAACSTTDAGEPVAETIAVFHHPVECVGMTIQGCLLVKIDDEAEYGALSDGIQGFSFEWGYTYDLEVDRFEVENPPADGSSIRRVLRRLVRKTRVPAGTEFEMALTGDGPVQPLGGDQYQWFNSPRFDCPPGTDCAALAAALGQGTRVRFRFAHPATATSPLQVISWQLCPNQGQGQWLPCDS